MLRCGRGGATVNLGNYRAMLKTAKKKVKSLTTGYHEANGALGAQGEATYRALHDSLRRARRGATTRLRYGQLGGSLTSLPSLRDDGAYCNRKGSPINRVRKETRCGG